MSEQYDDLDAYIEKQAARNPNFPKMVDAALKKRVGWGRSAMQERRVANRIERGKRLKPIESEDEPMSS